MPGGGGPSALRWMAAGAEFPCDVPGGGGASALRWMRCGVSVDIGAVRWMLWNRGIGGVGMAVFVEGFLLTFAGGMVILKVHIWEHSGPFGYLIPIWLVV
ncbi:MAG: hypothetical protein ACLVGQ_11045 [Blautia massiliensis (ex Durand et al. 2017)]|uniref:hypothetical protein n=1 Tax=Blautia massiliensis (ex Durand et al. 2017) TaxID=1737424 RepID=UPI00399CF133